MTRTRIEAKMLALKLAKASSQGTKHFVFTPPNDFGSYQVSTTRPKNLLTLCAEYLSPEKLAKTTMRNWDNGKPLSWCIA